MSGKRKVSLGELMGVGAKGKESKDFSVEDLHHLLGEKMPKLEYTPVGRYRLTSALRHRFGDGYRNLPGIENIMKEFDRHSEFNVKLHEMKLIKPKGGK